MTTTERQVALKTLSAIPDASFTACDLKGLNLLSDKGIAELVTLAGKSPADAIIQAKANADAALAGHAHGLNAQDAADAAKKAAADKAKADADAADAEPEEKEKKMKAAADRDEAERAAFFAKNPELKTLIDRQRSQEVARKAKLVAALKGGPLTDKQLEVKPLDELETLAAYAGAAVEEPLDYSGRRRCGRLRDSTERLRPCDREDAQGGTLTGGAGRQGEEAHGNHTEPTQHDPSCRRSRADR